MPERNVWYCCGGVPLKLDQRCQCGDSYEEDIVEGGQNDKTDKQMGTTTANKESIR